MRAKNITVIEALRCLGRIKSLSGNRLHDEIARAALQRIGDGQGGQNAHSTRPVQGDDAFQHVHGDERPHGVMDHHMRQLF
ncbi:hypothetical protein D3C72_2399340 [compost metagenome]